MMRNRNLLLYGSDEPLPQTEHLAAGPVTVALEGGTLRWIRYRGIEVVRGIAFLVRDRMWNTAPATIANLRIERAGAGFAVAFDALCETADGDLTCRAQIAGAPDGTIRFEATASPVTDFVTNRTGFVVLHPLDGIVGEPVFVTDVRDREQMLRFPYFVDPEPCFTDVRAMRHRVTGDVWATCTMEGDAWETEDHRNWLDASFKTYVRPLRLPYPYTLRGGDVVRQAVTISFTGDAPVAVVTEPTEADIVLGGPIAGTMPIIALRVPAGHLDEAFAHVDAIRQSGVTLVNGTVDLRSDDVSFLALRYAALAEAAGAGLALQAILPSDDDETELAALAAVVATLPIPLESLFLMPAENRIRTDPGPPVPPTALLARLYAAARRAFPGVRIGGGTLGAFAEFNRNLPLPGLVDFVAHTASSLVHAADDRTVVENLQSFGFVAETVRAACGAVPYRLAASGISLDEGPFCGTVPNRDLNRATLASADPRERGLFGAAWTLASIGAMAEAGIEAVSPAAVAGGASIFSAVGLTPAAHVIGGMARAAGAARYAARSSKPGVAALAFHSGGATSLWLANLTKDSQPVTVPARRGATAAILDETTAAIAETVPDFLTNPTAELLSRHLELGAFGVAHIRFEDES